MLITTALLASMTLTAPGLNWHQGDLDSALAASRAHGNTTVVYFWRNGSEYCASFYQETLADDRVLEAMQSNLLVSAQHGTDAGSVLFEKYHVTNLPTLLFLKPDGTPDDIVAGYAPADVLIGELDRIGKGEFTVTALERTIASTEADSEEHFDARFRLAVKQKDFGNEDGWIACLESM